MKTTAKKIIIKFCTMFIIGFLFVSLGVPLNGKAQSGSMTPQSQAVTQQQKVVAGDGAASDAFGQKLAISGITAVVGAPLADVNGNADQGKVFVYTLAGGIWVQQSE